MAHRAIGRQIRGGALPVTYREAIRLVATMSTEVEREQARRHSDRVLSKVAAWSIDRPAEWHELTAAAGVVDMLEPPPAPAADDSSTAAQWQRLDGYHRRDMLRDLWLAKPWTLEQLSAEIGVERNHINVLKNRWFFGSQWNVVSAGRNRQGRQLYAYQLMPS